MAFCSQRVWEWEDAQSLELVSLPSAGIQTDTGSVGKLSVGGTSCSHLLVNEVTPLSDLLSSDWLLDAGVKWDQPWAALTSLPAESTVSSGSGQELVTLMSSNVSGLIAVIREVNYPSASSASDPECYQSTAGGMGGWRRRRLFHKCRVKYSLRDERSVVSCWRELLLRETVLTF